MIESRDGYAPQKPETLAAYLSGIENVRRILGGPPDQWSIMEVGDGNLNLVFIVKGPVGGVAVKQALPYVRLVGESWPLPLSRAHYEHMALSEQARLTGALVPKIHHYDEALALIVMELLEPHIIMRRGMIGGVEYPRFAADISTFMARTLYFTSDLALAADRKKALIAAFAGNTALCKITEDLIFTDPYRVAALNRWTSPQLDAYAARWRQDGDLKVAVSRLKLKFLSSAEAMLHGDLHTGSVMLTPEDTRVIDPEFAFMGPMGFDVGAIVANFLLNFFAQDGHEKDSGERDPYRGWVLATLEQIIDQFRAKFLELWRENPTGDAYPASLFEGVDGAARLEIERQAYMDRLWTDTVGFAAAKMIRRILGLAHNIDLEWIEDKDRRATCEARALTLARDMMVNAARYPTIRSVTDAARRMRVEVTRY
ncbi:S-methyl-5-thioribose kinase [Aestuariivirga litoralis]|uniref:S-methyl-5-thioribose kinase n=1 Tax=Aestuariivirga litoralis TaxID=2650924 RepID=A0A2W2AIG8_9HYPH|nr:S-methyl-5-thioribose kinase [Aestuariivirga litoralis]PZF75081.1 S-methyl-5-thioribose kinase [Aestuariivirga litoralis]